MQKDKYEAIYIISLFANTHGSARPHRELTYVMMAHTKFMIVSSSSSSSCCLFFFYICFSLTATVAKSWRAVAYSYRGEQMYVE